MSELFATFGINWKLLIIQAVNFGVLLGALTYFLYTPVMRILDERRKKIEEGVRTAEAATRRLEEAQAEGETMVGDAAREAEGLVASARSRADERHAAILAEAEVRASSIVKDAEAKAREAQRQALASSEREIAKAAMLAAEKILKQKNA